MEVLLPQMDNATKTVEDLETLFFGYGHHQQKRQLLLGLGAVWGLASLGTSIYLATEVRLLHDEISTMKGKFQHVAHILDEEAHAVNNLIDSMKTLKATCQFVLKKIDVEEQQITALTNVIGLITMIGNLNTLLDGWRRGLEFLANGKLHRSLVDHKQVKNALLHLEAKARAVGWRLLHLEGDIIFKAPVSYMASNDFYDSCCAGGISPDGTL